MKHVQISKTKKHTPIVKSKNNKKLRMTQLLKQKESTFKITMNNILKALV